MGWTIFGKSPCEGDFVRHDLRDPMAIECFRWIADSVSRYPIWPQKIPAGGLRFLYVSASTREKVLIGTMTRSRDRVGRDFPLVAVHPFSSREITQTFSAVPWAWSNVLDRVSSALTELASRDTISSMASCLSNIEPPSSLDCREEHVRALSMFEASPISEFHERAFPRTSSESALSESVFHYAYHTMRVAVGRLDHPSAPVLLCPVAGEFDITAWLELLRRLLPGDTSPLGMLWMSGDPARLMVSLSDMPTSALPMIVGSTMESSRVWPLWTSNDAARMKARQLIEPLMPIRNPTLMSTIDALADRSPT